MRPPRTARKERKTEKKTQAAPSSALPGLGTAATRCVHACWPRPRPPLQRGARGEKREKRAAPEKARCRPHHPAPSPARPPCCTLSALRWRQPQPTTTNNKTRGRATTRTLHTHSAPPKHSTQHKRGPLLRFVVGLAFFCAHLRRCCGGGSRSPCSSRADVQ